jgi:hypothetical protein
MIRTRTRGAVQQEEQRAAEYVIPDFSVLRVDKVRSDVFHIKARFPVAMNIAVSEEGDAI